MTYRLVSWGANSHGQLGQSARSEECTEPREADLSGCRLDPARIKKLTGGAGHTLILDDNGRLYSCGWNNRGQLAVPENDDALLLREAGGPLKDKFLTDVACGWDSSAALTDDGSLYLWGSNAYGQLGLDTSVVRWTGEPFQAKINEKVKSVSMGLRHTVLVSQSGKVFVSGSNGKGQLGLGLSDSKGVHSFEQVSGISDAEEVACGQHHTIVTTTSKDLYAFGDNKHGQLGRDPGKLARAASPIKLTGLFSFEVSIEPHAGWSHNILLAGGQLFTWGRNCYGQLGAPGTGIPAQWWMERVEGVGKVREIATGSEHSVALTEDGSILCWGWNEHGNCGNGTTGDLHSPTKISLPFNYTASVVGAGAGHSLAVIITT